MFFFFKHRYFLVVKPYTNFYALAEELDILKKELQDM